MGSVYTLAWLRGLDCDGCTIAALGDSSAGGFEGLLGKQSPGLPTVDLLHPLFALETGDAFVHRLRQCAQGKLGPFGLLVESAISCGTSADQRCFAGLGEEQGQPISVTWWLDCLAAKADFVLAIGDCAAWGGPHSIGVNPTTSTGVGMWLGPDYRSRLGLPVVNLTGCSAPAGLLATVADLVVWANGLGPVPELDEHSRPRRLYEGIWKGALALWEQ